MSETIFNYFSDLMLKTYGDRDFRRIGEVLSAVENGLCGVETSCFTFPALLAAKGVYPSRSYMEEYGVPKQDGAEAATPRQRETIHQALKKAGFKLA